MGDDILVGPLPLGSYLQVPAGWAAGDTPQSAAADGLLGTDSCDRQVALVSGSGNRLRMAFRDRTMESCC